MPGLSEACAPRPTRAVALEPHARSQRDASSLPAHDTVSLRTILRSALGERTPRAGSMLHARTLRRCLRRGPPPRRPRARRRESPRRPLERLWGSIQGDAVVVLARDLFCANGVAHGGGGWRPMTFSKRRRAADFHRASPTHFFASGGASSVRSTSAARSAPAARERPPPALMPVADDDGARAAATAERVPCLPGRRRRRRERRALRRHRRARRRGGAGASASARAPDICGMCDHTFSETDGCAAETTSCVASGDCCADYHAVCVRAR